jgi:molybdenum cofactor cytidylyltransferase
MRFLSLPPSGAAGAVLVHGIRAAGLLLKKGRVLSDEDCERLGSAGIARVTVVRFDPGDVPEDDAATRVAEALAGPGVRRSAAFTGRVNLYAKAFGLLVLDAGGIETINTIDEALTVATLPPYAMVKPDEMIATVKIIPFAAPEATVAKAVETARAAQTRVASFMPLKAALVSTQLPGQKPSLLDKNRTALEARIAELTGTLVFEHRCPHETHEVAAALKRAMETGADIAFIFGASAITDRRDVIPAGIVAAGGQIEHFGMPVDPGNLLLLGRLGGKPVVGLPSCARSPKVNGFDFVLRRLFAGLDVTRADIMRMGVGGLLQEISTRPQPREQGHSQQLRAPKIAAILLAAGRSTRMGSNKLLAEWHGKPLVRWAAEAATGSGASPIIAVTGHEASRIEAALAGLNVSFVHNPDYALGLSTSLKRGIAAVPPDCDGALVLLGDMPEISATLLDRLIAAFAPAEGRGICVATHGNARGNPVLWAAAYFPEIALLGGDGGAKALMAVHEDAVCEIEAGESVFRDIDTPQALVALRAGTPIPAK